MNLFWFRDDLRIIDNTGLWHARQSGELIALYLITPDQWQAHDMAASRVDFLLRGLRDLSHDLDTLNIPLLVRNVENFDGSEGEVEAICAELEIKKVFCNRQYAVNERRRDRSLFEKLEATGVEMIGYHDFTGLPPGDVLKDDGSPYRVFTPFKKAWLRTLTARGNIRLHPAPDAQSPVPTKPSAIPDQIDGFEPVSDELRARWPAGESAALQRLDAFAKEALMSYKRDRDVPGLPGTSRLSPYLAAGMISPRQCLHRAITENNGELESGDEGALTWISELIWREFYQHLMFQHPGLCMHKPFKPETDAIPWREDEAGFQAWCEGRTGVPIVDAAMRELVSTGWMHNRCRMITAMFLTKNLLIDWRRGERFFMQQLIDGDLAQNNGGWQWSASTGTDAAPYFRIFNPFSQAEKFDPDAKYIKHWVPELKLLTAADIHKPERLEQRRPNAYPTVRVDLKVTRQRAIGAFKSLA